MKVNHIARPLSLQSVVLYPHIALLKLNSKKKIQYLLFSFTKFESSCQRVVLIMQSVLGTKMKLYDSRIYQVQNQPFGNTEFFRRIQEGFATIR